jgi:hypothetical protein
VNPTKPATIAITKKIIAQFFIIFLNLV